VSTDAETHAILYGTTDLVLTQLGLNSLDELPPISPLLADGAAWCWGENASGQLGDGGMRDRASPAPVTGVRDLTELSLGDRHTCARRVEGSVFCWGANRDGQLGDGTNLDRPRPNRVPALTDVAQIALGERHSCARLGDGTVRCWGDNDRGAVGDGGTVDRWTPTPVAW
jgi:alpha-tubulin suppressor-like RCC1 family protein